LPNGLPVGTIRGRVTDSITGTGISGVSVKFSITGVGSPAGPIGATTTGGDGSYTLPFTPRYPSAGTIWHYWISFSRSGYYDKILETSGAGGIVNTSLVPTTQPRPPVTPPPVTPPTAPTRVYELRLSFRRLPWANEAAARSVLNSLVGAVNTQLRSYGYGGIGVYGVNWSENYYWFRFKETSTIVVLGPALLQILMVVGVIAIAAGILIVAAYWISIEEQRVEIQAQATATRSNLATVVTEAYSQGKMTPEQYTAAMKAIGETVTVPEVPTAPFEWPTLEALSPIIILVIIVAAVAIAVSYLRR